MCRLSYFHLLHFAWVLYDAKCILVTRVCVCVCLSVRGCPSPQATLLYGSGVPCSCALLGGFAISVRVSLLWQHSPNTKCQRVLVLALCLVSFCHYFYVRYLTSKIYCSSFRKWWKFASSRSGVGKIHRRKTFLAMQPVGELWSETKYDLNLIQYVSNSVVCFLCLSISLC